MSEMITVPNEDAKWLKAKRDAGLAPDKQVSIGAFTGKNSAIDFVMVSEESSIPAYTGVEDFHAERLRKLDLSPEERSKSCFGHFSLTLWSLTGKKPDESMRPKVQEAARMFFEKNPTWSIPSVKLWFKVLGAPDAKTFDRKFSHVAKAGFSILERVEGTECSLAGVPVV